MKKSLSIPTLAVIGLMGLAPVALAATAEETGTTVTGTVGAGVVGTSDDGSGGSHANELSASATSGANPLAVTFDGAGLASGTYIVDYGDGANSGAVSTDGCLSKQSSATECLHVTHTYTVDGTYAAMLYTYVPCLWQGTPRCLVQVAPLGQVNIVVGSGVTASGGGSTGNGGSTEGGTATVESESSGSVGSPSAPPAPRPPSGGFISSIVHWFTGPDSSHTTSASGEGGAVTGTTSATQSDSVNVETSANTSFIARVWNGFWGLF